MTLFNMLSPFVLPLFIAALLLSIYAQFKVSSSFKKYSGYYTGAGLTAYDVAREILRANGISHVGIELVRGNLTDHFDPRSNTLRLSEAVYSSTSCAAIGVAAHEAGHAVQHNVGYLPIKIRRMLVPVVSFASKMSWLIIMVGFLFVGLSYLGDIGYYILLIGVGLFSFTTLFQLVTLPVEFNASSRAMACLKAMGRYSPDELAASKRVLSAAALTYVAAALASIAQLLRLVVILLGRRNNRR